MSESPVRHQPIVVTRCEIDGCDLEDVANNGIAVLQACTRCGCQTIGSVA